MDIDISVIIPVFNRESTIDRCIFSVLHQTFENIEVIVVNDGSNDGTLQAVRRIADSRIKVISHPNMGQGFARNTGINAATGKYVAFVDSDDTIEPEMLEVMYNKAEKENADVVQCNIYDVYPDGNKVVQLSNKDETVIIYNKGDYMDKYFSTCHHSFEVCNKLIRRNFLMDNNLVFRDTKKYFSEDLMFNLEMISHLKKICFISTPYYNYYQHQSNHMRSNDEHRLAAICELFLDYIAGADDIMKSAASYTAAMVIIYNVGLCVDKLYDTVCQIMASSVMKKYIRTALGRRCKFKHRILLIAMYILPIEIRLKVAKKYSSRWNI